jgi:hypothetical protein
MNKVGFGFDFYKPPKMENLLIPPKTCKFGKLQIPNYIDVFTKSKAFVPSPD